MPKIIKIKRGDVNSLNSHILADGEPAYTRHRVLASGVQRGETVDDHYFRIGDGTNAGGIVPGAASIGVGLLYSINSVAAASKQVEELLGGYYTPWVTRTFNSPYNPFRTTPLTISCLTPDVFESVANVHLGYGFMMFDGTGFEMRISNGGQYRFEADATNGANVFFKPGSIFWAIHYNTADSTAVTDRRTVAQYIVSAVDPDTTINTGEAVGVAASCANYSTHKINKGAAFMAMPDNPVPGNANLPDNYEFGQITGFLVDTWDNDRWQAAHPSGPGFVGAFYGFRVANQNAASFTEKCHGFHVDTIDATGVENLGTGQCRGFYAENIGAHADKAHGISIASVGRNALGNSGARAAQGLVIENIGYGGDGGGTASSLATGVTLGHIRAAGATTGVRVMNTVCSSSIVGEDSTSIWAVGFKVENTLRTVDGGWSYGFLQRPTGQMQTKYHGIYAAYDVDTNTTFENTKVYGTRIIRLGRTNAIEVHGHYADGVGNSSSSWSTGYFVLNVTGNYRVRGVHVGTLVCDSDQTSGVPNATGVIAWDVQATSEAYAYGLAAGQIRTQNKIATGVSIGSVYSTDITNLNYNYGFIKETQTSFGFKKFVAYGCGDIDSTFSQASIWGMRFGTLGTQATAVTGIEFTAIGGDSTGVGLGDDIIGINMLAVGNNDSTATYGLVLGGSGGTYPIRGGGAVRGLRVLGLKSNKAFTAPPSQVTEVIGLEMSEGRSNSSIIGSYISKYAAIGRTGYTDSTCFGFTVGFLASGSGDLTGGDICAFYKLAQGDIDEYGRLRTWDTAADNGTGRPYGRRIIVFGAGGQDIYSGHVNDTSTAVYGIKFDKLGGRYAKKAYGAWIDAVGCRWDSTTSQAWPADYGSATQAIGYHVGFVGNATNCTDARGFSVALVSGIDKTYGYFLGAMTAATDSTVATKCYGFYKNTMGGMNFKSLLIFCAAEQDVVTGGYNAAIIRGLTLDNLGDINAREVYAISCANIASGRQDTTTSNAESAYFAKVAGWVGSSSCATSYGIYINEIHAQSLCGGFFINKVQTASTSGETFGIKLATVQADLESVQGMYLGLVKTAGGNNKVADGIKIGNVTNLGTGTEAEATGIRLTGASSTNGNTYGIWLDSIVSTTSASGHGAWGVYVNGVTSATTGTNSTGVRVSHISSASGTATGFRCTDLTSTALTYGIKFDTLRSSSGQVQCISITDATTATGSIYGLYAEGVIASNSSGMVAGVYLNQIYSLGSTGVAYGVNIQNIHANTGNAYGIYIADGIESSGGIAWGIYCLSGNVAFQNLPTSSPGRTGQIWNDGGTLKISS